MFRPRSIACALVVLVVASQVAASPAVASPGAQFRISPVALDFGDVALGSTSADQQVQVTNVGASPVIVSMAGGAAGVFGGFQNCQGNTLNPGASCQITYQFTPTALGPASGSTGGSINGQSFAFSFRGNGVRQFDISPTTFDFGDVALGTTSANQEVTVTNAGTAPVVVSMAGGAAGDFGGFQDCQGKTLTAGASCHITYQFTPSALGAASGSTGGSINGQSFAFSFSGRGVPQFRISPTGFDFGDVPVGSTSANQQVQVTNAGTAPVVVNMAGGAAGVFGGFQNCQGNTLAAGASCQITYQFTPSALGAVSGSTGGSINGQPFAFSFSGNGIAQFRISPTGFDFGEVALGSTSANQEVQVTNVGTSPVVVSMAGGAAGVFGGFQNCQGNTLAAGASCQITYQFTPAVAGPVTGTTSGSVNGQPFSFSFAGTGLGDTTPPVITPSVAPPNPEPSGWYRVSPTVSFAVSDPESTITQTNGCETTVVSTDTDPAGRVFTCSATSGGGTSSASVRIKRDATPPTLLCAPPPTLLVGASGTITATVTDQASGPATPVVSAPADTTSAGSKTATLAGSDIAGNSTTIRCPYLVGFSFTGFLAPLQRDSVRAGASVPVKFALADATGARISDASAARLAADCAVRVTFTGGTPTPNCARYSDVDDQFIFVLDTQRTLPPGTYTIGIVVTVGGATVATGSIEVTLR